MRRRTKKMVVGTLALGGVLAAAGFVAGPEAGAGEWLKPVEHGYVDLLRTPYDATPGHGDSVHATCAPNGRGVEIGVHPFDGVARNFQVWELSPPAPTMLDNVTEAVWSKVYPFGYYGISYSGDSSYLLVDEDVQRALCQGPDGVPQPPTTEPPAPTVPPVASTVPPTVPVPVTEVPPPTVAVPAPDTTVPSTVVSGPAPSSSVPVEVLTQQLTRLPNTGVSTAWLVALGGGLLATGASLVRRAGRLTHGEDAS